MPAGADTMATPAIGRLPARYSFILNPYPDQRLSRCPKCRRLTQLRKFAFLIHVDKWGPLALGKTCRYCAHCELIIAHQDELEAQLAHSFSTLAPGMIGNEYLVLGTVEKRVWQRGLQQRGGTLDEMLEYVADFKQTLDLAIEGGWRPVRQR